MELESLLLAALNSPHGIEVTTSDPELLRQKLYAVRRKRPGEFPVSFVIPPVNSASTLWIVRKPDGSSEAQ